MHDLFTYSYAPSSLLAVHSPALRKQVGCRGRDILVLQMKTLQAASKEILYDVSTTDLQRHESLFTLRFSILIIYGSKKRTNM